jgi:3-oxoacyl-ACP reductase-like protein
MIAMRPPALSRRVLVARTLATAPKRGTTASVMKTRGDRVEVTFTRGRRATSYGSSIGGAAARCSRRATTYAAYTSGPPAPLIAKPSTKPSTTEPVAIVTGAARGIGRAVAEKLAAAGARVSALTSTAFRVCSHVSLYVPPARIHGTRTCTQVHSDVLRTRPSLRSVGA